MHKCIKYVNILYKNINLFKGTIIGKGGAILLAFQKKMCYNRGEKRKKGRYVP